MNEQTPPNSEDSMFSFKYFIRPVTGLANKMSDWLGANPAVVLLLAVICGGVWQWGEHEKARGERERAIKEGYKEVATISAEQIAKSTQQFIDANQSTAKQFIDANEANNKKFTETVLQLRTEHSRETRAVSERVSSAIEQLIKDRDRDREIMREFREWMKSSSKEKKPTNTATTLARPAGG